MARCGYFFLALILAVPVGAGADYLYTAEPPEKQPYVQLVFDNSRSMLNPDLVNGACRYGTKDDGKCKTRFDVAKQVVEDLLTNLDGFRVGLNRFAVLKTTDRASGYRNACGVCDIATPDQTDSIQKIRDDLKTIAANTMTPIGASMAKVLSQFDTLRSSSPACREYFTILITDGEESCDPKRNQPIEQTLAYAKINELRTLGGKDMRTFVVGFGPEVAKSVSLTAYAQRGGTSICTQEDVRRNSQRCQYAGQMACWNNDPSCKVGTAMFASDATSLRRAIENAIGQIRSQRQFSAAAPVIGSVPIVESEVNRVARNFMAYTSFEMGGTGYKGHLFGLRLFEETYARSGEWKFTDLRSTTDGGPLDLQNCGSDGNPCVFDAGALLTARNGQGRKIFTGSLAFDPQPQRIGMGEGVTLSMNGQSALPSDDPEALKKIWERYRDLDPLEVGFNDLPNHVKSDLRTRLDGLDEDRGRADRKKIIGWFPARVRGARDRYAGDDACRLPWPCGVFFERSGGGAADRVCIYGGRRGCSCFRDLAADGRLADAHRER